MATNRPKPFTLMPGPPPTEAAPPAKLEKKPIMSADLKVERDRMAPVPPRRGPQVADGSMGDAAFVAAYANAEELANLRRAINERRAKNLESWIFFKCDNPKCGLVMRDRPGTPPGGRCPKDNMAGLANLGHFRQMTEEETNAYLFEEAKRERAIVEQLRMKAFHAANAERATKGDRPLTFEEFNRQSQAEYEDMRKRQRELGQISGLYRGKTK